MSYLNYTFLPLNAHIDGGFGAIADSFMKAANNLDQNDGKTFSNSHLPINFLYRHAIELYLKSIIIVIHTSLNLSYGTKADPHILINEKWKPITTVHSIENLFEYFKSLVNQNKDRLSEICQTDWSDIPLELEESIKKVVQIDDTSIYFRYPSRDLSTNNKKSSWKQTSQKMLSSSIKKDAKPSKIFVEVNDQGNTAKIYQFEHEPLGQSSLAIQTAAEFLEGAHLGIRSDLAGGR
jgi:hypothetical protein